MPKQQTHLAKRGTTYYYRARVPLDLIEQVGKAEIVFSLGTDNRKEALLKVAEEDVKRHREYDRLRNHKQLDRIEELTQKQIDAVANHWLSEALSSDEEARLTGLVDDHSREVSVGHLFDAKDALAVGDLSPVRGMMTSLLREHGLSIVPDSDAYKRLGFALLKRLVSALGTTTERNDGHVVETPKAEKPVIAKAKSFTVLELFDQWKAEREKMGNAPRPKTLYEWELELKRFEKKSGRVEVAELQKKHIREYQDHLISLGNSPKTITVKISILRTLCRYAVAKDLIAVDPTQGVDSYIPPKAREDDRLPFSSSDLAKFFNGSIYKGTSTIKRFGEAPYWVPLVMAFTGARLEEVGQLRVVDVQKTEDGIHFLEITTEGEGNRLKTASSQRKVPIHNELIKCGFLQYVERTKKAKHEFLFPLLKVTDGHSGRRTKKLSEFLNQRYLREEVTTDPRKVIYSFRHTFKDACRESDIPEDKHDRITGHVPSHVGGKYGAGHSLKTLNAEIQKLKLDGVSLKHLHKAA